VNVPYLTENHGVPGSNPGPATLEIPANGGKKKEPQQSRRGSLQQRVNSRSRESFFERGRGGVSHAVRGVGVDGEGHPDVGVPQQLLSG
jgi:hypothetical protein